MPAGLRLNFRKAFLDELLLVEQYVGRQDGHRGRALTEAVFTFAYTIVSTLPEAFPTYKHPLLPGMQLRRAVFKREYALLYRVTEYAIDFVYFYHTRRDISRQLLEA